MEILGMPSVVCCGRGGAQRIEDRRRIMRLMVSGRSVGSKRGGCGVDIVSSKTMGARRGWVIGRRVEVSAIEMSGVVQRLRCSTLRTCRTLWLSYDLRPLEIDFGTTKKLKRTSCTWPDSLNHLECIHAFLKSERGLRIRRVGRD
jgi:hypothetical protein